MLHVNSGQFNWNNSEIVNFPDLCGNATNVVFVKCEILHKLKALFK